MRDLQRPPKLRDTGILLGLLVALFLMVWLAPPHHAFEGIARYQSVHLPFETLSIVVSMLVFGVAWNAYSRDRAGNIMLLACASLAVGLIDFAHMLSFAGMPVWVTPSDPEKAINFWLAARLLFALTLLTVAVRPWLPLRTELERYALLAGALLVSALVYWIGLFHQDLLPHSFIAGSGLTVAKIASEYLIVALLVVAAVLFLRQALQERPREALGLFSVATVTVLSELSFTLYSDVTDVFNLLGHLYKIIAYLLLYRTVFIGSVQEPFLRVRNAEQALRRANRALTTLSAGNRALIRTRNEQDLLDTMCNAAVEKGGYLLAWVGFLTPDRTRMDLQSLHSASGIDANALPQALAQEPTVMRAVQTGQMQFCQHIGSAPECSNWRAQAERLGFRSGLILPLLDDGRVFGVMALYAASADAFTPDQLPLLTEMSDDLAFGILTLRLRAAHDRVVAEQQDYLRRLQDGLQDTVQAIAATVEMRDPYTAGHQRRVAELAAAIAGEMGLPHEQVYAIHLAGIVHDLGKIAIPAEILSKPARLSEIEYSLIKSHPQTGYEILKDIDFPWPVAQMVLQHHERMDGSGYPQGLQGEAILLEARILAVADVIEAMASHRPYRAGLGLDAALQEIHDHSGTRYDATVAAAAERLLREGRFRL
ncbi:MAG: MASE3 domain-containing protein [Pseudomonadota bacterium]